MRTVRSDVGAPFPGATGEITRGNRARKDAPTILFLIAAVVVFSGGALMAADTDKVAVIETKFGKMVVEFYDKDATENGREFLRSWPRRDSTTARRFIASSRAS